MKRRRNCTIAVTLPMAAILFFGPLTRDAVGASASGLAHFTFDDGLLRTVSFSAAREFNGTASGQIDIRDPTPIPAQDVDGTEDPELAGSPSGVALHVDVDCLRVDGGTAVLGGEVTRSDVTRYVGKYVLLFVQGGARSEGKLTWGFYESHEGVSCGSLPRGVYTPVEIAGGSFKLRP